MTFITFIKIKLFALAMGLSNLANAGESDVRFSMNCDKNESKVHLESDLSGNKLNSFRQNVADTLTQYACQSSVDHPPELCALNNRWPLDTETWLIQTYCGHGAYLTSSVWFTEGHTGVAPLMLKFPTFNWNYKDSEKQHIETIISTGFIRTSVLTDASFDPNTKLISHRNYCCAGDLSTTIQWLVKDGDFNLYQLKVDNIQNGNLSPQIIIFYD